MFNILVTFGDIEYLGKLIMGIFASLEGILACLLQWIWDIWCPPIQSKKEGKDQESIQSSTTPDPRYQLESDNVTIRHHKREPRGQDKPQYYLAMTYSRNSAYQMWIL